MSDAEMSGAEMSGAETENLTVNGVVHTPNKDDLEMSLLQYLRERLDLTGTKNGCAIGACGCCTVVINGQGKRSCRTKLSSVLGKEIFTIEGLEGEDGILHPIQQSFIDTGAIQCGFCTPGQVMSAYALLLKEKRPDRETIRKAMSGNLCRCTGYQQIIDAVEMASRKMYPGGL